MTATPPIAGGEVGVFRRAGFVRATGPVVDEHRNLLRLTWFFARRSTAGLWRIALLASALMPALGLMLYVTVRVQVGQQDGAEMMGVAPEQQAAFIVTNIGYYFTSVTGWLLLFHATVTAPQVAADIRHGALLLYFSRPLRRSHYIIARIGASTLVSGAAVLVASVGVVLAHTLNMGWTLPAPPPGAPLPAVGGTVFWPLLAGALLVAGAVVSLVTAAVAHGCSALVRESGKASLLFGGSALASVGISWAGQTAWGRGSLARAVDLHHALEAPLFFALRLFDTEAAPKTELLNAGAGLALWGLIAVGAYAALRRLVANPPVSRGRA